MFLRNGSFKKNYETVIIAGLILSIFGSHFIIHFSMITVLDQQNVKLYVIVQYSLVQEVSYEGSVMNIWVITCDKQNTWYKGNAIVIRYVNNEATKKCRLYTNFAWISFNWRSICLKMYNMPCFYTSYVFTSIFYLKTNAKLKLIKSTY